MFSGIVECLGKVISLTLDHGCKHFVIAPETTFNDIIIGDSIAVNGVCLTVTACDQHTFSATAVPETLRLTNLDKLVVNDPVNLERSLPMSARIGGHYVQGHVDGMGQILEIEHDHSEALLVKISAPRELTKYMVNKGYVGLDGMSITIIQATDDWFTVTFIPHTQAITIVKQYQVGSWINIETDMMAKQIEKLLGAKSHANVN